jgi:hypothetical protein
MNLTPSYLERRFQPDTDGTGELFADVRRNDYAGAGSAWFHFNEIERFGRLLGSTFPMPPNTEISLRGGYWRSGAQPPELQDVLLGLKVYPVGTTGTIGVRVEVMDGCFEGQRPESRAKLSLELLTDYESIKNFGESTAQLVRLPDITARLVANAA